MGASLASAASLPDVHNFILPNGATVAAKAPPTLTTFPPLGATYNYGGFALYGGPDTPENRDRLARLNEQKIRLLRSDGKFVGMDRAAAMRALAAQKQLYESGRLAPSVGPPERRAAWRTLNRTIGTLDAPAMSRIGGASFLSKLNLAVPGALLPNLLKVLGPVGAAATAYQVCDAFLKAGCWLFKRNAPPEVPTSVVFVAVDSTMKTTFPGLPAVGTNIEAVTPYDTFWRSKANRDGCTGYGVDDAPYVGAFEYAKSITQISCYYEYNSHATERGIYWRLPGTAKDSATAPGDFTPAGEPAYTAPGGEPNFAPGGEDAAADAMASALAGDDEVVQNLAGAAVAEALPAQSPPEVEAAPVAEGEGALVPAYSGKTWTEYQSLLSGLGLSIKLGVVGQAAASPELGPNAVLTVNPQSGTRVAAGSTVEVIANPATIAAPSSAPSDNGIASPQEDAPLPAIDLSPLNVGLADKFPFGVPGWVAGKLGGFGGGEACPVFEHDLPFDRKIKADGCVIEPARAIYRPVLVVCSFLGLAWMFMGAAMGFGAGASED